MDVTILRAEERPTFRGPGDIRHIVTVYYRTGKGYEGQIEIEKPLPSREEIIELIKSDIEALEGLIGETETIS